MIILPLIDFFLPRLCLSCGCKLQLKEDTVCGSCFSKFKIAEPERIKNEYDRKFLPKGNIFDFTSLYVFERNKELQELIHSLKYGHKFKAGEFLGRKVAEHLSVNLKRWNYDIIVPVPLHRLKVIERGYNQSNYIAKGLSRVLNKPIIKNAVKRRKNTLSQTKMNLKERESNMKDAFILKKKQLIQDKSVLLVDDVITTGSTLNECAGILLNGGAKKVFAVSPAIADLDYRDN